MNNFNDNYDINPAENDEKIIDEEYTIMHNDIPDGCFFVKSKDKLFCCLTIIGQIEGHYLLSSEHKTTKYEHMIPRLISISQNCDIDGLLLIINTVGGDIEAGMAIAELIAGLKKPTVSLILGGGHSIGVPLAVSADYSFIVKSATMTIHPVRMNGLVIGAPQQLAYFQNMQERIIKFVSDHSGVSAERFRELMMSTGKIVSDFGSVLEGENAVEEGIIDEIGSIDRAIEMLLSMCK